MSEIPSVGALYWTLMRYAEIMSISKNRLTEMKIESHDTINSLLSMRIPSIRNLNSRQLHASCMSSAKRHGTDRSPLAKEDVFLTAVEMKLEELEKCLAMVESSGRAAWLKAFMHMSNQLRIFHPPVRTDWMLSRKKIPCYDIIFNGSDSKNSDVMKISRPVGRFQNMKKCEIDVRKKKQRQMCSLRCIDIDCKLRNKRTKQNDERR